MKLENDNTITISGTRLPSKWYQKVLRVVTFGRLFNVGIYDGEYIVGNVNNS